MINRSVYFVTGPKDIKGYTLAMHAARSYLDAPRWAERERILGSAAALELELIRLPPPPDFLLLDELDTFELEVNRYNDLKSLSASMPNKQTLVQVAADRFHRSIQLPSLTGIDLIRERMAMVSSQTNVDLAEFSAFIEKEMKEVAILREPLLVQRNLIINGGHQATAEIERVRRATRDTLEFVFKLISLIDSRMISVLSPLGHEPR